MVHKGRALAMTIKTYDVFVGSYGSEKEKTIHWLTFNAVEGILEKISSTKGVHNPSFLTVNRNKTHLYAVSEVEQGEVIAYNINQENKRLEEVNRQPTYGSPCFVELGPDETYIFTANYGGGSYIVRPINRDGSLGTSTDFTSYQSTAEKVQKTSNIHTIRYIPGTNSYIATDLGLNTLYLYEWNEQIGTLTQTNEIRMPNGSGPRHIAFHPFKKFFYVVNELNSTVSVYMYGKNMDVQPIQHISTIPAHFSGDNYCADIHITPSGNYLHVSNRGHHSITTFQVMDDGKIRILSIHRLKGEWPRNFVISPDGNFLLVANEHTNDITILKTSANGSLHDTENCLFVRKPTCINIVKQL